jgi:hypothetical protein
MYQQIHQPPRRWEVHRVFEPNRLAQETLEAAYEQVFPLTKRSCAPRQTSSMIPVAQRQPLKGGSR